MCPISANTYGIEFLAFKIRDMESNTVVFEVSKDPNAPPGNVTRCLCADQPCSTDRLSLHVYS